VLEASDNFVPLGYHDHTIPVTVLQLLDKKFILPFSASSESALSARVSKLQGSAVNLVDLAYTLATRRSKLDVNGYLIARQRTLAEDLQPQNLIIPPKSSVDLKNGLTFVFTGQGAQWAEMGKGLIEQFTGVRSTIAQLDAVLKGLKHAPSWTLMGALTQPADKSRINEVTRAQPTCTAIQIAVIDLLSSWGIELSAVIGHSSGEIAAAYAAGFLSSTEAITIAYYRGYVVSKLSVKGQMMAVGLGQEEAQAEIDRNGLADKVRVACVNSPENVTLSGDADGIETGDVLKAHRRLRRNALRFGRASVGELAEHEQRSARMRRDASARNSARDGETFFQQRGQSSKTLDGFERLGVCAFIKHDAERRLGCEGRR